MSNVSITTRKSVELIEFMQMNDFQVEDLGNSVYRFKRDNELPVYMHENGSSLYFEVDLGNVSALDNKDLYFQLLDLNTEILPVSLGIDTSNPDDPRLVLVESREVKNLDDNEILSVFDAMELAVDKAEDALSKFMKS